jgi:outer membrane protein assembly factor BamD (BamD/ComL family)
MASAKDMNTALEQLYEQSQTAIEQKNSKDADFYLARYMGLLVTEKTDKKFSDLYPLFEQYETLKVDAAINGNFDNDFINWYIFKPNIHKFLIFI